MAPESSLLVRKINTARNGVTVDLQLSGKTAVVTGASAGIGEAIARGLAAEGVRVAIVARRQERLDEIANELAATGASRPVVIAADVSKAVDRTALVAAALDALGAIDILVNSAGGASGWGLPGSGSDEEIAARQMMLGFDAHRLLIEQVVPGMRERGWGRIINITGKSEPVRAMIVFAAKAGLHAWSKGLSREVGPYGVTVNCLAPGKIMTEQMLLKYTEADRAAQTRDIPVGRFGTPEEIASLATFLASPLAAFISGTLIPVDGSMRMYQF